jgi:hypothetical protein
VVFLIDALVGAGGGALLLEILANGAVELFFEDRLGLDGLKLGLEVLKLVGRGVTAATGVVQGVWHIFNFIAVSAPGVMLVLVMSGIKGVEVAWCDIELVMTLKIPKRWLTYQLPFPLPSFLVLVGSASAWPDLAK